MGVTVNPLVEERMVVALPAGHGLAAEAGDLALGRLAGEVFIVYRRRSGPGLYDAIFAACHAAGFSPVVGQEAPRIVSTLNLVAAGLGIALVPESLRRMQMDGVVYRGLVDGPRAPLLLATRRVETGVVVRRFVDVVRVMARTFPIS
jgi:DNA-binding transcriptional LysR family regulator